MVEGGETGALAAPRREPGPAPRDAGANGSAGTCQAGTGPRQRVGARMPELRCQMVGSWRLPEWGSGAAHTPVSSPRGAALRGAELLLRQELQLFLERREQTVSTGCICSG